MFDWLRAAFSRTREAVHDLAASMVPAYMSKALWASTAANARYLHLAREAYGLNALVYSCIRLLAQSVPEAPLVAYTRLRDGEREPVAWDHPLQQLVRKPNELMTEYEMLEMIETHMDLAGRAFLWKQRANNGVPIALWPIRPDRMGPVYSTSDVDGERVLGGWSYALPGSGEKILISREDVIAFNFPDPSGETGGLVEGIAPTAVLAREIASDNEATSFVGSLLANYAQPSMLIKTKVPITDEKTAQFLKSSFMRQLGGAHRGEPALMDADTTVEKLSFNLQELEFPGVRANAETRVAAAYGVPPILVGLKAGLDRATYSNMEQARAYFAQTTLRNRWRRYGDQFTNDLAAEFGDDLVLAFDDSHVAALAESRAAEVKPIADAFVQGAVTINEYRQRVLGLPEMPGGDVFKGSSAPVTPTRSLPQPAIKADPEPVPENIAPAIATRNRHISDLESVLTDALHRLGSTVADRMLTESKALADVDTLYSDDDNEEINQAIRAAVDAIMADAVADASSALGVSLTFSLDWPDIDDALTQTGERIVGISETTRARITAVIKQSLELGEHPWEAAERLREDFGFSQARARTIARTEMAEAYASATLGAYDAAGVEMVDVWDGTDWDEPCRSVHGTTQTLAWYRGHRVQHPNCLTGDALVLAPNMQATFARQFDGEVIVLRTAANDLLTCTPNHPVLSNRGWVAAQDLIEGDYVIRALDAQRVARYLDPDYDDVPTAIEQVANAFRPAGRSAPATMPSAPEAFHGDGSGSDVYVVRANSFPKSAFNATVREPGLKTPIVFTDTKLQPFASIGAGDEFVHGARQSFHGSMGSGGVRHELLGSAFGIAETSGVRLRSGDAISTEPAAHGGRIHIKARRDLLGRQSLNDIQITKNAGGRQFDLNAGWSQGQSMTLEKSANALSAHARSGSDLLGSLAGLVTAVQVIGIERRQFSGHVYNLETAQGWYIASSIITHNCTRAVAPHRSVA